jgi:hypothetical protein
MNQLYFISAENDTGDNFDLFVVAPDPLRAAGLWRSYYCFEEGDDWEANGVIPGIPPNALHPRYLEFARIYEFEANLENEGALQWGGTEVHCNKNFPAGHLKLVAHIEP